MKKKITLINIIALSFVLSYSDATSQILTNGGFETWITGPSTYLDPLGWITNNGGTTAATVVQGAPRTGSHSVSLVSVSDGAGGYVGGLVGIYYNGPVKPLALSGYWKGNFSGTIGDGLSATVIVTDTTASLSGNGMLFTLPLTVIPNWTAFTVNVNYTNSFPATGTLITLSLTSSNASENGQVDDLTMTYVTGIGDIIEAHFPSAVLLPDAQALNHILYVDLISPASFDVDIYNIEGKRLYTRALKLSNGHHEFVVPTENLDKGIYFVSVTGKEINRSFKFVK
ncbi:MAG: T9SS type A sorting domain-containing protein [Bacteroidia bacterium]|nr:T9SS type A sorting domain-containing protein [Bacteroidia bacterium]